MKKGILFFTLPMLFGCTWEKPPTIYVSIVMHTEENTDFIKNEELFHKHRADVLSLAEMLSDEGLMFNYQSDWKFLDAMILHDTGEYTKGKNSLQYMKENLKFEIDPHAHESTHTYADVASLIEQLGVTPSGVTGGFLYYPKPYSELTYLQAPIAGAQYDYTWQAEILWGAATKSHLGPDEQVSGIWRPKSSTEFFEDKPGNIPYVGGYTKDTKGVLTLIEKANNGDLESDKMYTTTIVVAQGEASEEDRRELQEEINAIKEVDVHNAVQWVGLTETIKIWEEQYKSEPNLLYAKGFESPY